MFVDTLYNPPCYNIDDSFNSMFNLSASMITNGDITGIQPKPVVNYMFAFIMQLS